VNREPDPALARAWDLWREVSCAEIEDGAHWWEIFLDPDGADWLTFRCRRCGLAVEGHPEGDEIRSPWGVVFTIVTQPCGHCGGLFRRPAVGAHQVPEYCRRTHKNAAASKRHKARGKARSQRAAERAARQAELAAAYERAAPRLAAGSAAQAALEARAAAALAARCPTPRKRVWDDQGDALVEAAREARRHGRPFRAYLCDPEDGPEDGGCGRWHITARYARSGFIPRAAFRAAPGPGRLAGTEG
jgi:hypothetical protein